PPFFDFLPCPACPFLHYSLSLFSSLLLPLFLSLSWTRRAARVTVRGAFWATCSSHSPLSGRIMQATVVQFPDLLLPPSCSSIFILQILLSISHLFFLYGKMCSATSSSIQIKESL
uniref:Uncharacterized protein n=1 Tax=Oryza brachyantha TaxID=4533 RepID=J3L6S7_ORYBR